MAPHIEAPSETLNQSSLFLLDVFVRWCEASQVDYRSPSTKQIVDFLLHLFQGKNLQPSTIDGYRSAMADKWANVSLNISKDENGKRRSEIHAWLNKNITKLIGHMCLFTVLQVFWLRTTWRRRVRSVWLQWSFQPWPPLWINP